MSFFLQLQHEKAELEQHLEQEQEFQVNKLMKKIKKLENDTISKQLTLEQVRLPCFWFSHLSVGSHYDCTSIAYISAALVTVKVFWIIEFTLAVVLENVVHALTE